jgi:hypothetical protein
MVIDGASDYRSSQRSGLGRFVNMVQSQPETPRDESVNCKIVTDAEQLRIFIVATRDIVRGEELLTEYRQDLLLSEQNAFDVDCCDPSARANTLRSSWKAPPRLYSSLIETWSGASGSVAAVSIWKSKPAAWQESMASQPRQIRRWQKRALDTRLMRRFLAKDNSLTVEEKSRCNKLLRDMVKH